MMYKHLVTLSHNTVTESTGHVLVLEADSHCIKCFGQLDKVRMQLRNFRQ